MVVDSAELKKMIDGLSGHNQEIAKAFVENLQVIDIIEKKHQGTSFVYIEPDALVPPAELVDLIASDIQNRDEYANRAAEVINNLIAVNIIGRKKAMEKNKFKQNVMGLTNTCEWPGCVVLATQQDHRYPKAFGGKADERNLGPLCELHNRIKAHNPYSLVVWTKRA